MSSVRSRSPLFERGTPPSSDVADRIQSSTPTSWTEQLDEYRIAVDSLNRRVALHVSLARSFDALAVPLTGCDSSPQSSSVGMLVGEIACPARASRAKCRFAFSSKVGGGRFLISIRSAFVIS